MKPKDVSRRRANRDTTAEKLQDLMQSLVSQKNVYHAIVAVERGDRSFQWTGAVGEANPEGTPMRAETPFFIASITKMHIAAVILKLHEQGRLRLHLPVADYLPQPLITGIHRLGGTDFTNMITIQHLLSHTSGLADWLEDRPKGGQTIIEQLLNEGDKALSIEDVTQTVRDRLTPHFPPQALDTLKIRARYSDTNFQLLIAVIEAVTGQPLNEVFERELYQPLSLVQTFHPRQSQNAATIWAESQPLNLPLAMQSFGDLYSSAADMMTFMRALTQGKIFNDPQTFNMMQRHWLRFGFPLDQAALRAPGWPIEYGLGLMRFRLPRLFTLPYRIPAVIGHTGSTGSWLFYCPELDLFTCGTVDQVTAGAVPYRFVPKLLQVCTGLDR